MRYITIALSKGRLAKKALEIFEHIGITCDEMKDENTRKLIFTNEELGLKFFLAKPSDVPTYVEYGAADIGIVGKDTLLEEGRTLYEVYDLKVGNCKMCAVHHLRKKNCSTMSLYVLLQNILTLQKTIFTIKSIRQLRLSSLTALLNLHRLSVLQKLSLISLRQVRRFVKTGLRFLRKYVRSQQELLLIR